MQYLCGEYQRFCLCVGACLFCDKCKEYNMHYNLQSTNVIYFLKDEEKNVCRPDSADTVFPRIVSALEYFPPLNSFRSQNLLKINSFLL